MGVFMAIVAVFAFCLNLAVALVCSGPELHKKWMNYRKKRFDKRMAKVIGNITVDVEDPAVLMGLTPMTTLVADEALPIVEKCVGVKLQGMFVMKNERVVLVFDNDESFTITSNVTWPPTGAAKQLLPDWIRRANMGVKCFTHQGKKMKLDDLVGSGLISVTRKGRTVDKIISGVMYKAEAQWVILKFEHGLLGVEFSMERTPGQDVIRSYLIKTE